MATGRPDPASLGARVRDARRRLGAPRRLVAGNAGMSRRHLAAIERGRRAVTPGELRAIAGALGLDVGDLVPVRHVPELDRPSATDLRIEDVLDDVPECLPLPGLDPPGRTERRRAPRARTRLDQAFAEVWRHLAEVVDRCDPLAGSEPSTDVARLVEELETALTGLRGDPAYAEALERHQAARREYEAAARQADGASWRSRRTPPASARGTVGPPS